MPDKMPPDKFSKALDVVLHHEGGLVDNPHDPGGVTNFGISLRFLKGIGVDLNNDGSVDRRDIIGLTVEQARPLYHDRFWSPCRCAELPDGLGLLVFDSAVNQGPGTAARLLQQSVGARADGAIGPRTLARVRVVLAERGPTWLKTEFAARRALRYCRSPKILIFGLGWFRRLMAVLAEAITPS